MTTPPQPRTPSVHPCEYLLVVATSSEEDQLKRVARGLGLSFTRHAVPERPEYGSYHALGRIVGGRGSRLNAIRVDMGAHGFGGSASKAIFFHRAFGAQAIICLGMAFGVDRRVQRAGDVLVSIGLLPYDECAGYRDNLIRDVARAAWQGERELPPVIGGEMEGIGLLATSSPDNPVWIVVKGISDFADGGDRDSFPERRNLACASSAEFVLRALERDEQALEGSS